MTTLHNRFALFFSIAGAIGATMLLALPVASADATTVAAVFPPWWSARAAIGAAARTGSVVGLGRLFATVIVHDDQPILAARLRAAGALITLDADAFGGCRSPREDRGS